MTPNAAMETCAPVAPSPYWYAGKVHKQFSRRATSLMVHIQGHGPRRIYRSDFTRRYFYILKSRRIAADVPAILQLARS